MPVTLGTLSNLVMLDLSSNLLEGSIKESNFVKLLKLKELCLSWTNLFLNEYLTKYYLKVKNET